MIPDQWYAVLESGEVRGGRLVGVTRMGERLVFWRTKGGGIVCMRDKCAHRGAALSGGKIEGDRIECPFHGLQYDPSGRCAVIPANGRDSPVPARFRVHAYPARDEHGLIWIWWGEPREEYPPIPFFEELDEFHYSTIRDHWTTHYSRAIENQLDVVHLPFVHRTTIGRGNRRLVHGPVTRLEGDVIRVWVTNEVDRGQRPMRPEEMPEPVGHALLHFHFPNVWMNRLSEDFRIFAAFAPIDDENTMMYVRQYQRSLRIPVVSGLFGFLGNLGNRVILRQDRRVVVTQLPRRSGLRIGEQLFQGDRPIALYRRRRQELLDSAASRMDESSATPQPG